MLKLNLFCIGGSCSFPVSSLTLMISYIMFSMYYCFVISPSVADAVCHLWFNKRRYDDNKVSIIMNYNNIEPPSW